MKKLKDSTLVWLSVGCKRPSDRIKYGSIVLRRMIGINDLVTDFIGKLYETSHIIMENNEWMACMDIALGDQSSEMWRKASSIKETRRLKREERA